MSVVSCMKPPGADLGLFSSGLNIACGALGAVNIAAQATAGALSTQADVEIEGAEHEREVENLLIDQSELLITAYGLQQQFYAKLIEYNGLLDSMVGDAVEAQRQRAYLEALPANDPSFRIIRDSARMELASQLEYAARMAYLAARRAEYEYAARLSGTNFRISDIYRARTPDDILKYLDALRGRIESLPGGSVEIAPRDMTISIARDVLHMTDEATRVSDFRDWVEANTSVEEGENVLRFSFATSLLDGGLFDNWIGGNYGTYWLHKLSGLGHPLAESHGVSMNLVTDQPGLSTREVNLTQGGQVHLRSFAGCIFDYKLIAPAWLLGYDWDVNQDPEAATASFQASVNDAYDYNDIGFKTGVFDGRAISSTSYQIVIHAAGTSGEPADMDLQQLTDIELIISTSYATRSDTDPALSQCTRIDY